MSDAKEEIIEERDKLIPRERQGIWTAVTFVLALLALVMSFVAIQRINSNAGITQAEILLLNKKLQNIEGNEAIKLLNTIKESILKEQQK